MLKGVSPGLRHLKGVEEALLVSDTLKSYLEVCSRGEERGEKCQEMKKDEKKRRRNRNNSPKSHMHAKRQYCRSKLHTLEQKDDWK